MIEMKKILFPCDFSEISSRILPYVLSLSEKYDGTVHLLHVVEDLLKWGGFYVPHPSLTQYQAELLKGAEEKMEEICAEKMKGCKDFKRIIISGDPAQEILKAIEIHDVDLVMEFGSENLGDDCGSFCCDPTFRCVRDECSLIFLNLWHGRLLFGGVY